MTYPPDPELLNALSFQSLRGFQIYCDNQRHYQVNLCLGVSIPKRVSNLLWRPQTPPTTAEQPKFQSLRGFQIYCDPPGDRPRRWHSRFQSLRGFQIYCDNERHCERTRTLSFQSLRGFQIYCDHQIFGDSPGDGVFQSLRGFQIYCDPPWHEKRLIWWAVSIPKRVSNLLWQVIAQDEDGDRDVSIPKRVSNLLWRSNAEAVVFASTMFQSLRGFQIYCDV